MTRTRKTFVLIALFLTLMLGLSFFMSKVYVSNTAVEFNAPANFVYNAINDLGYQNNWNGKMGLDTSFHVLCVGNSKGVNASCDYKSDTYGAGVLRIVYSKEDSIIITDKPDSGIMRTISYKIVSIDSTHSLVKVTGTGQSGFITNLWNVLHRWKLSKHIKHGLDNLKVFLHDRFQNKVYNGYKITENVMNERYFITHRSEIAFENIPQYYTQNISALYQTALQNQLAISGMPCALFYNWDEVNGKSDMAAALPTLAETNIADTEAVKISSASALKVEYKGESHNSGEAHIAMDAYMLDHRLKQEIPIVEEYMTDPAEEPDPSKWVTNIYYYVSPK